MTVKRLVSVLLLLTRTCDHGQVASSISTSRRRISPIAASLALKLDSLTEDVSGGGAWMIIRAKDREDVYNILGDRFHSLVPESTEGNLGAAGADHGLDVSRATVEEMNVEDEEVV